ncbi:MAG TPA: TAT-variant-translocated molybdopterin oxidoreductase [Terriglobales bacterium]|nr:TAT-variant-translocated molybdopterin oxidoreductase [Terriglobales bacterium]
MGADEKASHPVCPGKHNLREIREKLASEDGPRYWRSLEELAGDPAFQEQVKREFPRGASEWLEGFSRRGFLQLMGASLALAGLTSCTKQPLEPIVPYVRQPEEIVPGRPLFFATAMEMGGYARPLLVESHMGRPTKVEGNPDHPASLGGSDIFSQASILELYDPDRSPAVAYAGEIRSYAAFLGAMQAPMSGLRQAQGAGLHFLTRTVASPTLADQMKTVLQVFPQAKWHQYEPVNRDNARAGAVMAFGEPVETQYRLAEADVILSLDADFLYPTFPGAVRHARDWASRRRPESSRPIGRLYVAETTYTATGGKADHRLPLRQMELEQFARAVAKGVGVNVAGGASSGMASTWLPALVKDLQQHKGSCVVIPGEYQPPVVHALAHAMNAALGNVGRTVFYTDPVAANWVDENQSVSELVDDMKAGKVQLLVILGGNPVYDTPAELGFGLIMKEKVPLRIHHGLYQDETAQFCQWHINAAHYLEAWGDTRAYDGTTSIIQPLIAPLYNGKTDTELMAIFTGQGETKAYDIVRAYWQRQLQKPAAPAPPARGKGKAAAPPPAVDFEGFWRPAVHDGFIAGTALQPKQAQLKNIDFGAGPQGSQPQLEINFRPDPSVFDGRFSNNAWLQELPKPVNKLTWDNGLLVGVETARQMGLKVNDVVELKVGNRTLEAAVWVQAGQPANVVTGFLGYGRRFAGRTGTGFGFNLYRIRTMKEPWSTAVEMRRTGDQYLLASTQGQQSMDTELGTRDLVISATADEYAKDPKVILRHHYTPEKNETLYNNYEYTSYAWGMSIDLSACVGCNACIIACQSENNIAVVGKEQVNKGRHMHWIRVDTYYEGDRDNPKAYFQPVPCMQCENAPCEYVCPVGATVHSSEGLNDMVYNRCVGTRYCSNNCPYKVRRFNFMLWQDWNTPQLKMMRNPEVSVRSRGVMEKCSYCVQRITQARIDSEREDRKVREADLMTACQQACPADAIVFGDINNADNRVSKLKGTARNYGLLAELNTRPRTTYLAAINNPNPELPPPAEKN